GAGVHAGQVRSGVRELADRFARAQAALLLGKARPLVPRAREARSHAGRRARDVREIIPVDEPGLALELRHDERRVAGGVAEREGREPEETAADAKDVCLRCAAREAPIEEALVKRRALLRSQEAIPTYEILASLRDEARERGEGLLLAP